MRNLLKPTLVLTVTTLLGQFVSFFVNIISAKLFGADMKMDAYLAAQAIPNFISVVLLGGLGYVFIPTFIDCKTHNREQDAWKLANSMIIIYVSALAVIALIGMFFAGPLLELTVPGLSPEAKSLAKNLSYIIWPTTVLSGMLAILVSLYHAYEQFIYQALMTLIAGILYILILLVFGNRSNGIYVLSLGLLISSVVNVVLLMRILNKQQKIRFNFRDKTILALLNLQLPILLTSACSNATRLLDRFLASELPVGTISYLSYADKLKLAIAAVLGGGISVTLFPLMAKNFSGKKTEELKENISFGLRVTAIVVLPIVLIGSVLAAPVVELLFQRGQFTKVDTNNVASLLPWFLLSIVGATMANVTARAFYVLQKTKMIAVIGILEIVLYLVYMPLLFSSLKGVGIAIAVMLLWNSSLLLQLFVLDKKYGLVNGFSIVNGLLKVTVASLIPAALLKLYMINFDKNNSALGMVLVGGVISLLLYFLLLYLFRLKEFLSILQLIKLPKKINR